MQPQAQEVIKLPMTETRTVYQAADHINLALARHLLPVLVRNRMLDKRSCLLNRLVSMIVLLKWSE